MASEKNALPPYIVSEPPVRSSSSSNKKTVLLASYGAAVTALLVAGVVFGSLLYVHQQQSCVQVTVPQASEPTKIEVEESDGERQAIQRDFENEVELIQLLNNGSTNGTLLALDFRKSLTGMYIPSDQACYVIGGIDTSVPSPFRNEDRTDFGRDQYKELKYQRASDYPVLDRSFLPMDLHEPCKDRQVYWLERSGDGEVTQRSKRQTAPPVVIHVYEVSCCPKTKRLIAIIVIVMK